MQRARIIAEAAYQGQQKQWGYEEQARQAKMKGDLDVWTADTRAAQIASSRGSVDMANMGLLANAGATLFEKYNTFGSPSSGGGLKGGGGGGYDAGITDMMTTG